VQAVLAMRWEFLGLVTQSPVEETHKQRLTQDSARCSQCGCLLTARGPVRQTVETLVGAVPLKQDLNI